MLRRKVDEEGQLKTYGGLRDEIGMITYLNGPKDATKFLKLQLRVGDVDLPKRRERYTRSRDEKEVDAQNCPCGKAM